MSISFFVFLTFEQKIINVRALCNNIQRQILKWMKYIYHFKPMASINFSLISHHADPCHLHFNYSVHCLVISHHSVFISLSGYLVGGYTWGAMYGVQGSQFNSMVQFSASMQYLKSAQQHNINGQVSSLINQNQECILVLRFLDSYYRVLYSQSPRL